MNIIWTKHSHIPNVEYGYGMKDELFIRFIEDKAFAVVDAETLLEIATEIAPRYMNHELVIKSLKMKGYIVKERSKLLGMFGL